MGNISNNHIYYNEYTNYECPVVMLYYFDFPELFGFNKIMQYLYRLL